MQRSNKPRIEIEYFDMVKDDRRGRNSRSIGEKDEDYENGCSGGVKQVGFNWVINSQDLEVHHAFNKRIKEWYNVLNIGYNRQQGRVHAIKDLHVASRPFCYKRHKKATKNWLLSFSSCHDLMLRSVKQKNTRERHSNVVRMRVHTM